MKLSDLTDKAVVLIIQRDVKNPKPDRRKTRDFACLETWKAGTRLLFKRSRARNEVGHGYVEAKSLYGWLTERDPGFEALIDACEKAPRTLRNALWIAEEGRAVTHPSDVLGTLLVQGKLSLDDIDAAVLAYEEMTEEEQDHITHKL
jgi:hypothetical protein